MGTGLQDCCRACARGVTREASAAPARSGGGAVAVETREVGVAHAVRAAAELAAEVVAALRALGRGLGVQRGEVGGGRPSLERLPGKVRSGRRRA